MPAPADVGHFSLRNPIEQAQLQKCRLQQMYQNVSFKYDR